MIARVPVARGDVHGFEQTRIDPKVETSTPDPTGAARRAEHSEVQHPEIAELRVEIAELRARVARLETRREHALDAQRGVSRRAARAELLPVLAVSVQDRAFTAVEVLEHAAVDLRLELALAAAGIRNARSLGHLLARVERHPLGPVRVVRIGDERDGAIWRCVPCP
jgi:hypothetical protein